MALQKYIKFYRSKVLIVDGVIKIAVKCSK